MDYRVTDTFLEFYEGIPDEHVSEVDAVLRSILDSPNSAFSRQGRIEAGGQLGGAWIVRLTIDGEPHNLYWVQEGEIILFIGIAPTI